MEKIVEQGLLYDFYGELLTDHQRHVYEDVVFNDMSLSEIAEEQGISRQGVHDLIKRCDRILAGYEEKLRMVEKFNQTKRMVEEIKTLAGTYTIAEEQGISRQGVHDLIKRCDRILAGYEEKLRMVEKFNQTKRMVEEIKTLAGTYKKNGDMSLIDRIEAISEEIGQL